MKKVMLQGERIYLVSPLGRIEPEDLLPYFQNTDLAKYMTAVPDPYTLQDAQGFLKYLQILEKQDTDLELGIFLKETDTFVGMVAIENIDHEVKTGELGYWLAKDFWGRGLAREATTLALDYGFSELGLQRSYAYLNVENYASLALLGKLGFQVEGKLRRHTINKGKLVDRYICGLLKEEWLGE